jgi:hypothetical protein
MQTNATFKQHRRWLQDLMTPAFSNNVAAPGIYAAFGDMISLWKEKLRLARGRPFEASTDVYRAALDAVWVTVFANDLSNSCIQAQLEVCSITESLPAPRSQDEEAKMPFAPYPASFQSVITLSDSLETSLKSPFPSIAHVSCETFYATLETMSLLESILCHHFSLKK